MGVINGNLISGDNQDYAGNYNQIPQTMAGIEIEIDSDEFQEWYRAFTTFPYLAISEAQYQINAVINKYIEGGNRTNRQKQSCFLCYRALQRPEDYTSESTCQGKVKPLLTTDI